MILFAGWYYISSSFYTLFNIPAVNGGVKSVHYGGVKVARRW